MYQSEHYVDEQDLKNSLCSLKNEISIKVTLNRATILFLAQAYKTTAITDITVCSAISLVEQSLTGLWLNCKVRQASALWYYRSCLSSNIETLRLNNSEVAIGHFSCPSLN